MLFNHLWHVEFMLLANCTAQELPLDVRKPLQLLRQSLPVHRGHYTVCPGRKTPWPLDMAVLAVLASVCTGCFFLPEPPISKCGCSVLTIKGETSLFF